MSERGFANVFDLIHYIDSLCRHRLRVRTVPLFQGGRSAVCANDCVCCRQRDVRTADRNLAAPGKRADQRKLSYSTAGSFLFLFSANYGQMDSLVDDGSKQFRKTRIIALIAPIVMIAMWGVLASKGFTAKTAIIGIETLIIAMAAYYHLKHIIIKDVDFGLIRVIRNYNILALVYAFLCMAEILIKSFHLSLVFVIIVYVLQCAVMLAFVPVLERGVNKWTI